MFTKGKANNVELSQDDVRGTPSDWVREMPLFIIFLVELRRKRGKASVCVVNFPLKQCVLLARQNTNKGSRKVSGVRKRHHVII